MVANPTLHPQLPLGFEPSELTNFDTFVEGENSLVSGLVKQLACGEGEQQIYLWSTPGLGKTHLLQAACHYAAKFSRTVCYFNAQQMLMIPSSDSSDSKQNHAHAMFEGLELLDLVCLDDLQEWVIFPYWQNALFDLINRIREKGGRLILASSQSPENSGVALADLASRLCWGPVFQLKALNDSEKMQALKTRAKLSGLDLPDNVAEYLLSRFPRDLDGLFQRLLALDKASMSMQRPLTIPLIKTVFPEESL